MSEAAIHLTDRSNIYTQTTGNMTRIFFGKGTADVTPIGLYQTKAQEMDEPEQISLFGTAPAFSDNGLYTHMEQLEPVDRKPTARDLELAKPEHAADAALTVFADRKPTARDLELAKPDTKDMAVQPLENYDQVKAVIDYFASRRQYREACLLVFGFCTGLRISDLLQLKVGDITTSLNPITFRPAIDIREQKTGKRTVGHLDDMLITLAMQEYFRLYIAQDHWFHERPEQYMFTTAHARGLKPMTIRTIQKNLAPAFAQVCPHLHCSTHTMRKTFVSVIHVFSSQSQMSGAGLNPATACQIALRHASAATTLAYMGTMKSGMLSLRRAVSDFVLGKTKIKNLRSEYTWETIDD